MNPPSLEGLHWVLVQVRGQGVGGFVTINMDTLE